MKKKRAILAMLLVMVLIGSMYSTGQQEVAEQKKLQLYFPSSTSSPLAESLKYLTEKYNATNPDIEVDAIYGGSQADNVAKALTSFVGGNSPDMIIASAQHSYTFFDAKAIVPIDKYIEASGGDAFLAEFYQPFLGTSTIEGSQYGIPWQKSTALLYWNKDLFRKAGLDPDKPPRTWDEMVEIGKQLTVRDSSNQVVQWGFVQPMDFWVLQAYVYQAGNKSLSDTNGKYAYMDDPATVQALQFICDIRNKYKIAPVSRSWGEASNDFISGFSAMLYHSTGNQGFLRENAKFEWGAAFLPAGPAGYGAVVGGAQFYLFKTTEVRQQAAWDFIVWMTQPENTAYWMEKTGYLALKPQALETPVLKDFINRDPRSMVAFDQLQYAKNDPVWHQGGKVIELINEAISDAMYQAKTPAEAMSDLQIELDLILTDYR